MRFVAALLVLWLLGCGEHEKPRDATLALSECKLPMVGRLAECGIEQVFENRQAASGRKIALNVVRLRASGAGAEADPVFMLAGGPGQAATEAWPVAMRMLQRVPRSRDVVFVDQRGTGKSAPLDCEVPDTMEEAFRERAFEAVAKRCAGSLGEADTRHYTSANAADDLEQVRVALGYDEINLIGGSYGTRLALTFAKRHPNSVRAMVLDGVAPPSLRIPLPLARDAHRALDLVFGRCERDAACAKAYPNLRGDFTAVADKMPHAMLVKHPRTGEKKKITLSRAGFLAAIRGLLYSPELQSLLPFTIDRALNDDFQPFVTQTMMLGSGMQENMSLGLFLSVVCAEDVPRIRDDELEEHGKGFFLGNSMVDEFRAACEVWPHGATPKDIDVPVSSDVPTLLVSGELDPVTPPSWAEQAAKTLSKSRHIVVPGMSHGVTIRGCMPHLVADFIDAPSSLASIDDDCVRDEGPPFFIDFAGPPQ